MTFIIQSIAFQLIDRSSIFNAKVPDLSDLEKRTKHEKLIVEMIEEEKIYLDEGLSLKEFSDAVSLPPAYVSELINQKFNCSFKRLINRYRLEEAKRIIKATYNTDIKLIEVAFEAGFSNKVSFYRTFKELDQISPSDYLEKIKNQENA